MRKIFTLLLAFVLTSAGLHAQQTLPGNQNIYGANKVGFVYDKEVTFGMALASPRNFILSVRSGKQVSYDVLKFWDLSLGNIRHSRERKENSNRPPPLTNRLSRSYTFGKENQLYALRLGFGRRKYLSEKARQRGVAVGYSYQLGPSLGLLKPYYLEVDAGEPGNPGMVEDIRHAGENTALFLNQDRIYGASTFANGLGEIGLRPGLHAAASAHFGLGAYDEMAKSLELGLLADFFIGDTDILVESDLTPGVSNPPLYLSLFVKVQFGKRW